jgi:hypothetical protein
MTEESPRVIDKTTAEAFVVERDGLLKGLTQEQQSAARELQTALPDWRRGIGGLGSKFISLSTALRERFKQSAFLDINKLVVVDFALRLTETIAQRNIPDEVLALYPAKVSQLLAYLRNLSDHEYNFAHDDFVKDVRFASGLSVPCGAAQVVDLSSILGYKTSARLLFCNPLTRYVRSILRSSGIGPWFQIHTDSRSLNDFDEPGWDACYMRIAALLRVHPEILGTAGRAWFYDPVLETVSPRLTYLRQRPVERGAFMLWSGTTDIDIRNATAKSANRRCLYEAGKYRPVSYILLWPREHLIAWADSQREKRP